MKKNYHFIYLFILISWTTSWSQQDEFGWRIGIGSGFANYYGDLSQYSIGWKEPSNILNLYQLNTEGTQKHEISYAISLERKLSNTTSFLMQYSHFSIQGNDRFDRKGNLNPNHPNFSRALNFKSNVQDFSVGFVFSTDNGKFFKKNAFLSPYFLVTAGYSYFDTKGDLYNDDGQAYAYLPDGFLSNNGNTNGNYETSLAEIQTEGNDYSQFTFNAGAGIGLKFRASKRISLHVESNFKYFFTDYIDDVSGNYPNTFESPEQQYASNPTGVDRTSRGSKKSNDLIAFHSIALKYSFGKKRNKTYRVPAYRVDNQLSQDTILKNSVPIDKKSLDEKSMERNKILEQRKHHIENKKTIENDEKQGKTIIIIEDDEIRIETKQSDVKIHLHDRNSKKVIRKIDTIQNSENQFSRRFDTIGLKKTDWKKSVENKNYLITPSHNDSLLIYNQKNTATAKTKTIVADSLHAFQNQQKIIEEIRNADAKNQKERQILTQNNKNRTDENSQLQSDLKKMQEQNQRNEKEIARLKQEQKSEFIPNTNNQPLLPLPINLVAVPNNQPENSNAIQKNSVEPELEENNQPKPTDSLKRNDNIELKSVLNQNNIAAGFETRTENDSIQSEKLDIPQNQNLSTLNESKTNEQMILDTQPKAEVKFKSAILPKVELFFAVNSVKIDKNQESKLLPVVKILNEYPHLNLVLTGKADATGNPDKNLELSQTRAQEIEKILTKKHQIQPQRISVFAIGQTMSNGKNVLDRKVVVEFTEDKKIN